MASAAFAPVPDKPHSLLEKKMARSSGHKGVLVFAVVFLIGILYAGWSLASDLSTVRSTSLFPYLLLGFALW